MSGRNGTGVTLALLALVSLFGCGKSGDSRFAGLSVYRAPGSLYLIRYMDPPWKRLDCGLAAACFEIPREGSDLVDAPDAGVLPVGRKYFLSARIVELAAPACVTAKMDGLRDVFGVPDEEPPSAAVEIETAAGNSGFDSTYRYFADDERRVPRYARVVCLEAPPEDGEARSLELYLDSIPDPREGEVDEMIAAVEVKKP